MTTKHDLKLRGEQRAKYFEDPKYLRWSTVIPKNQHSYGARSELAFLVEYLYQDRELTAYNARENFIKCKGVVNVNWHALYEYLDERKQTAPDWLRKEVNALSTILDEFREELYPSVVYVEY